ncbi:outer membrane beta-barrel protein [Spirosoma taeanense]|uniref:Outer membrane beta-barrel protein n=1 Tax=Spirosoma taeanense TaxID=2735870 RepID=A0A6M5Y522_9BACT|nr:outer membrane beta-barrel protein [Spirosoma taeanense]QJW88919.1 outer membrane beta-barrel protein [Spirosoma taeanense]
MKPINHFLTTALIMASTASFAQTTVIIKTDSTVTTTVKHEKYARRATSDFGIYLGFNNLSTGYELRPVGSRFLALAWHKRIPLSVNGPTKLRLIVGPEIAWNNFMFEGNNTLVERNNQLILEAANTELDKSKLVTTQLNLPMMLNLTFRSGLVIGAGAYAGIRLDSYTKVKSEGAKAVRTHGSFNLNPVRWGLTTEIGFRGSAKLFGRYEPKSLFRAGEWPDARVWSVGLKL